MIRRIELLTELIHNPHPEASVLHELAAHPLDNERHLAFVSRACFITNLRQFENGLLTAPELKAWASRLLERSDIGFEFGDEGVLEEAIFQLAHEEIYGMPDDKLCQHIEAMLERRDPHSAPR